MRKSNRATYCSTAADSDRSSCADDASVNTSVTWLGGTDPTVLQGIFYDESSLVGETWGGRLYWTHPADDESSPCEFGPAEVSTAREVWLEFLGERMFGTFDGHELRWLSGDVWWFEPAKVAPGESARFSRAESHRAADARQSGAARGGTGQAPKGLAAATAAPVRPGLQITVEVCVAERPARPAAGPLAEAASETGRQCYTPSPAAPRRDDQGKGKGRGRKAAPRSGLAARPAARERRGAGP